LKDFKRRQPDDFLLVKKFADDLIAQGLSELRIRSYVRYLLNIREAVGKPLSEFTIEDVKRAIVHYQMKVNRGERTESSVFEARKTLKKFFRWYDKPELVEWFSIGSVENKLSPSDLITEGGLRGCSTHVIIQETEH